MKKKYKIVLKEGTKKEYIADTFSICGDWLYIVGIPDTAQERIQTRGHKAGFAADAVLYWESEEIAETATSLPDF